MRNIITWEVVKWLVPLVIDNAIKLIKTLKRKKHVQEEQTSENDNQENGAIQGRNDRAENQESHKQ